MACKEIAALRLGLMNLVFGSKAKLEERKHDLLELGDDAHQPGPLHTLSQTTNYEDLVSLYGQCLSNLQGRLAESCGKSTQLTEAEKEQQAYYQSLMIVNKKIEMELLQQRQYLLRLLQDLHRIHHYVHEIHPPSSS